MLQVGSHIQICNNCSSSQDLLGRTHAGRSVADCRVKQICPRSSTKPGRQKIPTFCSAAPGRRLPATVAPLRAHELRRSVYHSAWVSHESHLRAHLCSPACPPSPWEQKDFDGNKKNIDGNKRNFLGTDENKRILMGTDEKKEYWWELDGNKNILMGTKIFWWEQEEFDGNFLGTWWEQNEFDGYYLGTWWKIKPQPLQKDKKHPLGACLRHPTGLPLQKNKRHWRSSHALS